MHTFHLEVTIWAGLMVSVVMLWQKCTRTRHDFPYAYFSWIFNLLSVFYIVITITSVDYMFIIQLLLIFLCLSSDSHSGVNYVQNFEYTCYYLNKLIEENITNVFIQLFLWCRRKILFFYAMKWYGIMVKRKCKRSLWLWVPVALRPVLMIHSVILW